MKRLLQGTLAGVVALAGSASQCSAQRRPITQTSGTTTSPAYFFFHPFHRLRPRIILDEPVFPEEPTRPIDPKNAKNPTLPNPNPNTPNPNPNTPNPNTPNPNNTLADALAGAGDYKSVPGRLSPVLAGTGIGSAVSGDPTSTSILTPLVMPGLFNAGVTQSAIPSDRVSFGYGYFNGINVSGVGSNAPMLVRTPIPVVPPPPPPVISFGAKALAAGSQSGNAFVSSVTQTGGPAPAFNLHSFNFGGEKTLFDGLASVYISLPLLLATDNVSGQQINGLGDVNAGFKVILYQNADTRNTLTGGLTVSFPTAHPAVSSSLVQSQNGDGSTLVQSSSTSINPTFFQPWLAGLLVLDRVFVQEYFGVVVPTDGRVATFLNSNFTVGYTAYKANDRLFSSLSPVVGIQALIPVTDRGTPTPQGAATFVPAAPGTLPAPAPPGNFTFSDQVFATAGAQIGLGRRCLLTAAVVVPLSAPRSYPIGGMVGINYFY